MDERVGFVISMDRVSGEHFHSSYGHTRMSGLDSLLAGTGFPERTSIVPTDTQRMSKLNSLAAGTGFPESIPVFPRALGDEAYWIR